MPGNADHFFDDLAAITRPQDVLKASDYRRAPDEWGLITTDIVNSTALIEAGQHKTVNFVAAMAIGALKNQCAPLSIPFLFGGDGSVVMVPAGQIDEARRILARVRAKAAQDFDVELRVSLCTVREIRSHGADVLLARYEPSAGNSFGIFSGGGVEMLESAMRGRGYETLAAVARVDEDQDDGAPLDLSGLSCRWDELQSRHGKMVTIIVSHCPDPADLYDEVLRLTRSASGNQPVHLDTLRLSWPPAGLLLEARAQHRRGPRVLTIARVLGAALFARAVFWRNKRLGGFDPSAYRHEMVTNTDFCRFDDTLCFVLDCADAQIEPVRQYLADESSRRGFRFGMHTSDTALMTCLVTSASTNLHVHFVDGGSGGYTEAAKALKALPL